MQVGHHILANDDVRAGVFAGLDHRGIALLVGPRAEGLRSAAVIEDMGKTLRLQGGQIGHQPAGAAVERMSADAEAVLVVWSGPHACGGPISRAARSS